jgi:glycosyltransferase involved in cell wall biosynthesis
MNILIFAGYYHPHIGGYIKNIHELAKRLVGEGYEIAVVTCNTESLEPSETIDGVLIQRLPSLKLLGGTFPVPKPSFHLLSFLFSKSDYDVVVTQTRFFVTSLVGMLYAKIHKLPLVHVERGTCHSVVSNRLVSLVARIYDHTMGTAIVKAAKLNVCVSESARTFVLHLGGKDTMVVYNGVDMPTHTDLVKITYVGRLVYAKGVQDLIRAFELCCNPNDQLRLVIIGDGNYRKRLERQARASQYGNRILFYGELEHDSVMEMLATSDIFVNPSYSEGLPTSVMEAASLGLPIIATDVGGTSEIIIHKESGLLIQPHDIVQLSGALESLILNQDWARQLGAKASNKMGEKFNWGRITQQWDELLRDINEEKT